MDGRLVVLVTGGSGALGKHVVKALLDRGHQVVNIDRRNNADARATYIFGDVRNRAFMHGIMKGCDVVCHLAEIPNSVGSFSEDEVYWGNTTAGSVVMQTAADLKMRRVVYTSSCQVYGCWDRFRVPPVVLPMDETHPFQPQNVYAHSKVCNEGFAQLMWRRKELRTTIFRPPWVLTEPQPSRNWLEFIMRESGPMDGMGTYIHATDLAQAYVAAAESDQPGCEAYNLMAPESMTGVPIRERLIKHHPDYPPLPVDWPEFKCPVLSDKAREHFGWNPKWSFREFLRSFQQSPVAM